MSLAMEVLVPPWFPHNGAQDILGAIISLAWTWACGDNSGQQNPFLKRDFSNSNHCTICQLRKYPAYNHSAFLNAQAINSLTSGSTYQTRIGEITTNRSSRQNLPISFWVDDTSVFFNSVA
ncbi:hypothetical protein B0H13DRAFT_2262663 [Mycena leptocephala]|nr:hypothetical protein B0H13DRAFT_2262663 [Mycena leptocephala]